MSDSKELMVESVTELLQIFLTCSFSSKDSLLLFLNSMVTDKAWNAFSNYTRLPLASRTRDGYANFLVSTGELEE